MRNFSTILLLLVFPFFINGQQLYPLLIATDSIQFQVIRQNDQLAVEIMEIKNQFSSNDDFLFLNSLELSDADMILSYEVRGVKKTSSYTLDISLLPEIGYKTYPELGEVVSPFTETKKQLEGAQQLIWMDVGDDVLNLGQKYTLLVRKTLLGLINCEEERPEFNTKQQWPHYVGAGAGVLLIGMGQLYRQQKEDAYNNYLNFWTDGKPIEDAEPFLSEAQKKEESMKLLTYSGIAILGVDAILFFYRQMKIKKKQQTFDKYCHPDGLSISIVPFIEVPAANGTKPVLGSTLTITF